MFFANSHFLKCKPLVFILLFFSVFSGCQHEQPNDELAFSCDIESIVGWTDFSAIQKFKAHTGNYACLVDTGFPFSIGFRRRVGDISQTDLLRAQVSGWVYCKSTESRVTIVCAVDSFQGKPNIYLAEDVSNKIRNYGKWQYITSVFYFPKNMNKNFILTSYFWNTGKEAFYTDDMEVKFTTY